LRRTPTAAAHDFRSPATVLREVTPPPDSTPANERISVVIPAYQAARYLPACLRALRACDEQPFEVIVVDDGSTDGTAEIARRFDCVVLVNERNRGAAAARNRGASHASGGILVFLDADVAVERDVFVRIRGQLRDPQWPALMGHFTDACPASSWFSRYKNNYTLNNLRDMPVSVATINTSLCAVRRSFFEQVGAFDASWPAGEDNVFGVALVAAGGRIRFDRSIRMGHLKEFTFGGLLRDSYVKTYWMARHSWSQRGRRLESYGGGEGYHPSFSTRARFVSSVALVAALLGLLLPWPGRFPLLAAVLAVYLASGYSYWRFIAASQGVLDAAASALLSLVEMNIAAAALVVGTLDEMRGKKRPDAAESE
jgi:glycosyltransferase involved in cell wall biosynthesis